MVTYPVHVQREAYRGKEDKLKQEAIEYNRLAGELESYINKKVEESDEYELIIIYDSIAAKLHLPLDLVRKILYSVDGGDNGITVRNPKVRS
jgi:CRISPR/Cas system type I-B associated protein Csh2 (Cas7 group RAMP superfamily)